MKMSIQATELRIGNWFISHETEPEKTIYYQVEEICRYSKSTSLGVRFRNNSCWTSDPEPIELTEEWFVKFGFEKETTEDCDWWYLEVDNKSIGFAFINEFWEQYYGGYPLEYVHELQNRVKSWTGKELTIK